MKLFYKEKEVDLSKIENIEVPKKIKGGIQIRYYQDSLYVAKGKRIQKYLLKGGNITLCEDIQLNVAIQDFIINDDYIIVKNSDCAVSVFSRKRKEIIAKKTWKKTKIEQLCWKDETIFFITINKVLCEMDISSLSVTEICNYEKTVNGECTVIKSFDYNEIDNEYRCFVLFYPNDILGAKLEEGLIKVDLTTLKTEVVILNENIKTLCSPTFHLEQERICLISKDTLNICNKELCVTKSIKLPYYKVVRDGGGLFKPEEFVEYPVEIRFLENQYELLVMYEHSILCLNFKDEKIIYQNYIGADLLLSCIVLEHDVIIYNTGFSTFVHGI